MKLENRKYLHVNGIDQIGKYNLHLGRSYDNPNKSCLIPVFAIKQDGQKDFFLQPGFLSTNEYFYPCPFSISYVQLDFIKYYQKEYDVHIEANLKIFSKDFISQRDISIHLNSDWLDNNVVGPMHINEIVNALNVYIEYDNNLDELNDNFFTNKFDIKELKSHQILRGINNLAFKYYSNDRSRIGKDNKFWNEVEIQNLPENNYLTELYLGIIKKSGIVDSIEYSDSMFFATYANEYAYSPSHGRQEIMEDTEKTNQIKDILKYEINQRIDLIKEKNERLKCR